MNKQVKVLPHIIALRVLKHTEIVGNVKISANKKRKHDKALLKLILEAKLDGQAQKALSLESAANYRVMRSAFFRAKYGNPVYAANGLDIVSI